MENPRRLLYRYMGKVSYMKALSIQEQVQEKLISGNIRNEGVLLFLYHNPVITTGKYGNDGNLLINVKELERAGIEYVRTSRGGDATYHGPGQLVCYPILNLKRINMGIRKYITSLERVIMSYLSDHDIEGRAIDGLHGVWVRDEKIASIGVRVKRHVTMHGFALNINNDLSAFDYINPCGMRGASMTSLKKLTGEDADLYECTHRIIHHFRNIFKIDALDESDEDIYEIKVK